jgi:Flp pilus assembly protein TadD
MRSIPIHNRALLSSVAVLLCLGIGGCKTTRTADTTGSIGFAQGARSDAEFRREVDLYAPRYRANPRDVETAIRYARALRGIGQRAQAVSVLEQASLVNPKNQTVLGAFGRALADAGDFKRALEVLSRAHSPDQPDWRILSVQGAVLDQMGQHGEAQKYYASALRIVPDEPSVLSNLGLSYALAKDLKRAEATLRRASARPGVDPRVRQNLALVIGLQGRFAEAETLARADLPPDQAAANVSYLREMLAQPDNLKRMNRPS